jgi:hypothetical protein
MSRPFLFSQLSPGRQALVRLCQATNYGVIERLHVRGFEPTQEPPPFVMKDLKLDHDEELRPELELTNFELRGEVQRLMDHLDELCNGIVERLEVHAGVPRRIVVCLPGCFASCFQRISRGMPDVKEEHDETV